MLNLIIDSPKESPLSSGLQELARVRDISTFLIQSDQVPWPVMVKERWALIIIEPDPNRLIMLIRRARQQSRDRPLAICVVLTTSDSEQKRRLISLGVHTVLPNSTSPERLIAEVNSVLGTGTSDPDLQQRECSLRDFIAVTIEAFEILGRSAAHLLDIKPGVYERASAASIGWIFMDGVLPRILAVQVEDETLSALLRDFPIDIAADAESEYRSDWAKEFVNIIVGQLRDRFVNTNSEFSFSLPESGSTSKAIPVHQRWPVYHLCFGSKHGEFTVTLGFAKPGHKIPESGKALHTHENSDRR